ncbi:MotA/TolQ/ExbB proton channel family protein [uncultured Boseongicola sp.]|jgi:biopolymer transport protein ExbB|uniref:MotA/TolQ/ExbB proton channel family protein n=1 Tax=uncultured Boseongicola sp. TaxID=1648499 RepID=UPI00261A8BBF|nr:MotA/TolQ/ExbB proton channel family protein [uncultured Boseongicola sp.]
MSPIMGLLDRGGVVIWIIAALSVVGLAVILWKVWRLAALGAWGGARAEASVEAFRLHGQVDSADGGGVRAMVVRAAMHAVTDARLTAEQAREETERVARRSLADARRGLRVLEVISTVAPLLGLLGTVLGMIVAFQALQTSGSQADASVLAGGIWEALLTTAAGMAVAIPAALALAWFEAVIDRVASDLEDLLARVFLARPVSQTRAAE